LKGAHVPGREDRHEDFALGIGSFGSDSRLCEQVRQFSPVVALSESTGKLPPIFVARAGKDQIPDLLPGLDRFVAEALARNTPLVLYNQPDGEHGFDNQEGDPRSREIVREAVEFLKRNLTGR